MLTLRRVFKILKNTGAIKVFLCFIILCVVVSFILKAIEPNIKTIGDGLWYCFIASTTIGFGDIYATTTIGRILTIFISLNGIFVFAMMTGVVVSYYMEYLNNNKEETISLFLEKLENLPNLPKKDLIKISEKIKQYK